MVYQFDFGGDLVATHDGYRSAARAINKPNSKTRIREACINNHQSHGFYWSLDANAFSKDANFRPATISFPKIFVFDVETSLMLITAFSLWEKYHQIESIERDWHLLTWSGCYIHDGKMLSDKLTPSEALDGDDKRIIKSLWEQLDNADIVITHNGERFDLPKFTVRMIKHDIKPYSPVRSIDTLKHVRKIAGHTSNKLDYIAQFYEIGQKIHTDRRLWRLCILGSEYEREQALQAMEEYNKEDVNILLDTYLKIRPYMRSHPNLGVYINDNKERCHYCGSDDIQITNDFYTTNVSKFQLFHCNRCNGHTPSRFTTFGIAKRKSLLKSLPL